MKIREINRREGENKKLHKLYDKLQKMLDAVNEKTLTSVEYTYITNQLELLNKFDGEDKQLMRLINKTYENILNNLAKNLKLFPKNHYLAISMVMGMLGGLIFSSIISTLGLGVNLGFSSSVSLSLGMFIGVIVGFYRDKTVKEEGRQLDIV